MFAVRHIAVRCFGIKGVLPADTEALRRVVMYRCSRAGILEVEIVLKDWATVNLPSMSHEQLVAFHDEVLEEETPDLLAYLTGQKPAPQSEYFQKLMSCVEARKNRTK